MYTRFNVLEFARRYSLLCCTMNMHPAVINNQLQANVPLFRNMITPISHNDMQPRARGLLGNSAGAAGVFSSPGSISVLTLISVSVPPPCYRSST